MEISQNIFAFIVALAAVVNGLGIVRIVGGLGEYLRRRETIIVKHYLVYNLVVGFQLLTHVLFWWALLALRDVGNINFLQYLYVLLGPTLLFLATSVLVPDVSGSAVDLRSEYKRLRKPYYSLLTIFWIWSIAIWPVFGYTLAPTWIFAISWMGIMIILYLTDNARVHAVLVSANWLLLLIYIGVYAIKMGTVSRLMMQ